MAILFGLCLVWGLTVVCASVVTAVYAWFDNEMSGHLTGGWWHIVVPYVVWFVAVGAFLTLFLLHHAGLL